MSALKSKTEVRTRNWESALPSGNGHREGYPACPKSANRVGLAAGRHFRSTAMNRHREIGPAGPLRADIVVKVFLGRAKFIRAADASSEGRREGPYRFIQNRPGISVVELSKNQLSRDF
jgi:hypothetical protein